MRIILDLTDEETEKLIDQLWQDDEGPEYDGWRSKLAIRLGDKVLAAIDEAKQVAVR